MTDAKAKAGAPAEPQPVVTRAEDMPVPVAAPATGPQGDGEEEYVPHKAKAGWVEDPQGRYHEVEDTAAFLGAYPGSKVVKEGDVTKTKVGYAEPKGDEED